MMDIMKKNNVKPDEYLTNEQKDMLAEHEFIERRKKELGKKWLLEWLLYIKRNFIFKTLIAYDNHK